MRSIRTFLVIALLATITLITFVAGIRGYRSSMLQTELLFDRQLHDIADLLEEFPDADVAATGDADESVPKTAIVFQIWDGDVLTRRSDNAPAAPMGPLTPGYNEHNFGGYRWRTLARRSRAPDRWLLVAQRADTRFRIAEEITLEGVAPILLSLPVAGVLIWAVVGAGMRPLTRLARELGTKASDDLTPLRDERTPVELRQVIDSTNDLLDRLAASFERERRFAADAAHELRTPISVLKVHLYNLARDMPPDDTNLSRLKDGIERMNHLVEQILALHRTAPDRFMAEFTVLDLNALAREVIGQRYSEFAWKEQQAELVGGSADIVGDRFALETLLDNILSNAGKYTPRNGRVRVTTRSNPDGVILLVEDSGPGIAAEERSRVFERFYRVGGDRHGSNQVGCGLGLAIVRDIAELHDARITLGRSAFESGLSVRVEFPTKTASSGRRDA